MPWKTNKSFHTFKLESVEKHTPAQKHAAQNESTFTFTSTKVFTFDGQETTNHG
jgi:hypothetical protein